MQHTGTTFNDQPGIYAMHRRHDRYGWYNCHQPQPDTTATIQQLNPSLPVPANADPCFPANGKSHFVNYFPYAEDKDESCDPLLSFLSLA